MDKQTKKEFQNLGRMIKKGFDGVDKRFETVDKGFEAVDKRFETVDKRFNRIEGKLDTLEKGHEDIVLRLDQVAYTFELRDLEKRFDKRLKKIELKLGLAKR